MVKTRQRGKVRSSIQAATLKKCKFDEMKDMVNDPKYATMTKDGSADNFRGYATLLRQIKQRVQLAQRHAIYSANEEMLRMYWDVGCMLQQSQQADGWGKKTLQRLSVDLKNDYPEIKGFSVRNMQCMMQFFIEYNQELTMIKVVPSQITQSVIAQSWEYNFTLPVKHLDWTHNLILMQQVKDIRARYWYMVQNITNHWTTRFAGKEITVPSACYFAGRKTASRRNMPYVTSRSLSVFPTMSWGKHCQRISRAVCLLLRK